MIPVNSVEMYEVIVDFEEMIQAGQTAQVDTKYKTVNRKVRPVVAPLSESSWEWMKGVKTDPSLWDPNAIGHWFTNETLRELKIGEGGFLRLVEEDRF